MDKTFNLVILKPDKIIYEGRVLSLIAPCESGYRGILADHAPLAANTVPGRITIKQPAGQPLVFRSNGGGFMEVLKNNVSIILNYTDGKDPY